MNAAAFSSDGRTMAASSNLSDVALYDVAPLRFRSFLTSDEGRRAWPAHGLFWSPPVAFSPNGELLVAAGARDELIGWNMADGSVRFHARSEAEMVGLAFFPDGRSFVTVGPAARHWSAEDGSVLGEFGTPGDSTATAVAVFPDGGSVLVGTSSGDIVEFEASTRRAVRILKGHSAPVTGIALSPDGSAFASTAGRFDPRIWNRADDSPLSRGIVDAAEVGESLSEAERSTQAIALFAWILGTARGLQIVGAPTMGSPPVLASTLETAAREPSRQCGPSIAYSPDGRFIAATANLALVSGDFHLLLVDMARREGRIISAIEGCSVAFSRDGRFVVTAGAFGPRLWDVETGARIDGK